MLARSILGRASLALVAVAACRQARRAPDADSTRTPGAGAVPGPDAATARAPIYPGTLAKPIDDYSGDDLYELTRELDFTGIQERDRRCRGVAGCEGTSPSRSTLVEVSAVAGQDSLNATDLPEFGVVQARAINRGEAVEARYGFRPGESVRYYLIVQRDPAGGMRWRMEELDAAPPRRHLQVGAGRLVGCGHPWLPGARADFRSCDPAPPGDTAVVTATTVRLALDAPMWVECNAGCCIAVAQSPLR